LFFAPKLFQISCSDLFLLSFSSLTALDHSLLRGKEQHEHPSEMRWTSMRVSERFLAELSLILMAFLLSYFSHSVMLVQLRKAVKAQICCVVCGFSLWRCLARSVPDWSLFEVTDKKPRHFHLWLILFSHLSHAFLSHVFMSHVGSFLGRPLI